MPIISTRGVASAKALGLASGLAATYIEDVFSTYLYTGNSTTQTITNGIDLAGKGGLVWTKNRESGYQGQIYDSVNVANKYLVPSTTAANATTTGTVFNSNGFTVGGNDNSNATGQKGVSWTFRKQPKFFDVVTYTGDGTGLQVISHNLGSVPGCVIIKRTNAVSDWPVYHRGNQYAPGEGLALNLTSSTISTYSSLNAVPTSTTFTVGYGVNPVNISGGTYVAYLFAHNAGGFGLTGTDNVISCGSYTSLAGGQTITLGYEPQFVLIKKYTAAGDNWYLLDTMRGMNVPGSTKYTLAPNLSTAEESWTNAASPTATGFFVNGAGLNDGSDSYIYIAIRRGPMKVPTTGTSVYNAIARTGTGAAATVTGVGFAPDLVMIQLRSAGKVTAMFDRLRGATATLQGNVIDAEGVFTGEACYFDKDVGSIGLLASTSQEYTNRLGAPNAYINHFFKRAPGFFDEVCYTGTGVVGNTVNHNLAIAPELIITKRRNANSNTGWSVGCIYYKIASDFDRIGFLNLDNGFTGGGAGSTYNAVGASSYTLSSTLDINASAGTYVAYLFATLAGISKVGSYTGNGSSQTIACGFTGGARFILIKRTDDVGDWYVWDSTRGIVAGNDPHLSLNTTATEVTTDDSVDTDSSGFIVNQLAATNINVSAATYIFLAIS